MEAVSRPPAAAQPRIAQPPRRMPARGGPDCATHSRDSRENAGGADFTFDCVTRHTGATAPRIRGTRRAQPEHSGETRVGHTAHSTQTSDASMVYACCMLLSCGLTSTRGGPLLSPIESPTALLPSSQLRPPPLRPGRQKPTRPRLLLRARQPCWRCSTRHRAAQLGQ